MQFPRRKIHRLIAVWLSAVLVLLSFIAAAHATTHLDEGGYNHCTLCFHQHQLNKLLPGVSLPKVPQLQVFEQPQTPLFTSVESVRPQPQARGPPLAP
ncbi:MULTISPECIES: ABC-type zinc uptake system zinc chaperone [Shewanella]|uniref:ABC-type zinc uptake system zinc chaperone n=1 Tax=Shewanella TaxID=22 RepID=UPI0021AC52B4|nr:MULTISPECIES: ABC-type zinc uptake system zinc chaperone [Shewanella]